MKYKIEVEDKDPHKEERDAMFSFYKRRMDERVNPLMAIALLIVVALAAIYGVCSFAFNVIWPMIKVIF